MKVINCNGWLSSNWGPRMSISRSITDPVILANDDNLYYTWFYESIIGAYTLELGRLYFSIDWFYYKLRFYQHALFNINWYIDILGEDDYFDENN
jgi:hypothetical protein